MAGVEGFLAAQVDDERALVHEPHGLHRGERRETLNARPHFVEDHGGGGQHGAAREVWMMANELEQIAACQALSGFSGGQV